MPKIWKTLVLGVLVLALLAGSLACHSSTPVIQWRMATSWTADNLLYSQSATVICDRIKQLSGGRLVIVPSTAGTIVGSMEVFDAVSRGTVEMGHCWPGYRTETNPVFELFSSIPDQMLPQEWTVWLYGPARGIDLWREYFATYNVVPFPGVLTGPEYGFFTRQPVTTAADFKGLRLRTVALGAEVLKELGATLVDVPAADIKSTMQKGQIDGFEFCVPAVDWPLGFQDVAGYVVLPGWHQPSAMYESIVNQAAYDKLPDDLKAIVEAACKEVGLIDSFSALEGANAEAVRKFAAAGVKTSVLDAQSLEQIAQITNRLADQKAAADPKYAKILKSQRDFRADYRTWEVWEEPALYPVK
jgi:TRAP-type mannitol/chloroaromatic compound transport system substrate-binding protein